jgi:superfamily II DNA or RNA helicase
MNNPISILKESKNWNEFKSYLSKLTRNQKGDCFEELTRYFLKIDPIYISKIKNIWNVNEGEVPFEIKKKLNLPEQDEGIDLIAETFNNKFWTIQSKYKSNHKKNLQRSDVSTFLDLTFNVCNENLIELALICTPCEQYSYKFDKLYNRDKEFEKLYKLNEKKINFIYGTEWSNLNEENFIKIHHLINKKNIKFKSTIKAKHQIEALKKIKNYFDKPNNHRGKLILPCGTGKSLVGYWASQKLRSKNIVVVVPSLALIKQTFNSWAKENISENNNFDWIVICSDKSTIKSKRDEITIQLADLGVRVENKVDKIAEWLKLNNQTKVVFVTYDSSHLLSKAAKVSNFKFDLGIFDEAHKTAGNKNSKFTYLLKNQNISINKRIFMTATERFYSGVNKNIYSMSDSKIYGNLIHELSFKNALKMKREDGSPILVDYQLIRIVVSDQEVIDLIAENKLLKPRKLINWDKDIEAHTLASALALKKAFKEFGVNKLISFHSSLGRAELFSQFLEKLNKYGKTNNNFIAGDMPTYKRQNKVDAFINSKKSVLSNARCLTEGVDIPICDAVLFADPKESKIDIVQACGRALRPYKGKKNGFIIVPILINSKDTKIEKINKAYKSIMSTIDAIGFQDTRIVDYFDAITSGKKYKSRKPTEEYITSSYEKDFDEIYNAVNLKIVSRLQGLIKKKLNIKKILEWSDAYYKRYNKWPNSNSGNIDGEENETWTGVSISLQRGLRGLTNKYTLADLLQEFRNVKNIGNLITLSSKDIISWAIEHKEKTGEYPNQNSGKIISNPSETWNAINDAMSNGRRGLKKQSLVVFLEKKLDRIPKSRIGRNDLSTKKIIIWIKNYYEKHKKYPLATSKEVIPNSSGTKWYNVATSLSRGLRGLDKEKTFLEILQENFNYKLDLNENFILSKADDYFEKHRKWPTTMSGKVDGLSDTWKTLNSALKSGNRGLEGNQTLAGILFENRAVTGSGKHKDKDLKIEDILSFCDEYFNKHEVWPNSKLRKSKKLVDGTNIKWSTIISALHKGSRGLPKISLSVLLRKERGYTNKYSNIKKVTISKDIILSWGKIYKKKYGKRPTAESGNIDNVENETWGAINEALRNGRRGLKKGNSLSKLFNAAKL